MRASFLLQSQDLVVLDLDVLSELIRAQCLLPDLVLNNGKLRVLPRSVLLIHVNLDLEQLLYLVKLIRQMVLLIEESLFVLHEGLWAVLLQAAGLAGQVT